MAMTIFAGVVLFLLYWLSAPAGFIFYLGMAAMSLVLICLTGLAALIVRREIKITKNGIEIIDQVVKNASKQSGHTDDGNNKV